MKFSSDQTEHCMFLVVLHRSFRAQKAHVLLAGVGLFLSNGCGGCCTILLPMARIMASYMFIGVV